jgi:integrase/recombinase XerD
LVWNDLSFEKGTILVRHGKGDKFRFVPLGKTIIRLLARYKAEIEAGAGFEPLPGDPIFPSTRGTSFTARGMNSIFVRLSNKVGFRVTAHMLRRGYAKTARKLGRDWEDIQQSMGHTSIDQTRTYVGFLSQDDVQKARSTSPVDRALRITSKTIKGAKPNRHR